MGLKILAVRSGVFSGIMLMREDDPLAPQGCHSFQQHRINCLRNTKYTPCKSPCQQVNALLEFLFWTNLFLPFLLTFLHPPSIHTVHLLQCLFHMTKYLLFSETGNVLSRYFGCVLQSHGTAFPRVTLSFNWLGT